MQICSVEIACLPIADTAPQIPFPLDLFKSSSSTRPAQPLSAFSQVIEELWTMHKPYDEGSMLVAYKRMVAICEDTADEEAAFDALPAETIKNHVCGFKLWLGNHHFPITTPHSRRFLEWFSTALATYDKLLDLVTQSIETQPEPNPGSRVLQCTGLDVLKLIILNTWTGFAARQLILEHLGQH